MYLFSFPTQWDVSVCSVKCSLVCSGMEWVCAVVRCLMILLEPVFTRKVGHNRAFKAYMRTGTRACVFSVGRCVPIRCYWDLKLIGSVGRGWQGMAGLVGWLGWVGLARTFPRILTSVRGVWGREERKGRGRGWDCVIHVYYVCVLSEIVISIFNFEKEAG